MKKMLSLVTLLIISTICFAQTSNPLILETEFEKSILNYTPQKNNLSDKTFNYGSMIIGEVKKDVDGNTSNFKRADYFNVLSAFLSLNETDENIQLAFRKFSESEGCCEYFLSEGMFDSKKYDVIRKKINLQKASCSNNQQTKELETFDIVDYAKSNKVDLKLIQLLDLVDENDQKYRSQKSFDNKSQSNLDKRNQLIIDSLFNNYKTYIGTTLAGEKYRYIMWSVIQHSHPEMMGRYLPFISKAVEQNELESGPLKMLIDRYYGLSYGYQIFGTQSGFGFELADEVKRSQVIMKYNIH